MGMQASCSYGGIHDELLTAEVDALRQGGRRVSQHRLVAALRRAKGMRSHDALRVVNDYCQRGVLQAYLADGPYDAWLTQQIETAYGDNRGVTAIRLAKRLGKDYAAEVAGTEAPSIWLADVGIGLVNAIDIVEEYFARYALKGVLGPYPLAGVIVVSGFELLFLLPIAWLFHTASFSLTGRMSPAHGSQYTSIFLLLLMGENIFRNWRRTRSRKRWESYETVREELLERFGLNSAAQRTS